MDESLTSGQYFRISYLSHCPPRARGDRSRRLMTQNDPSYDQSVSSIHNRLFFRLFQAGNTLDRQTAKALGITTVQWSVLGALSRPQVAEGMSFSELADYLVVSRQSLDGVLKRLERDEHVLRVADTVDRRAKKVVLTDQGKVFWDSLQPKIYEFYRQALASFRFDDKVSLVHFLNQLNKGMDEIDLGAPAASAVEREEE
jgi:DNA-binding MarR family transcriptional regulator